MSPHKASNGRGTMLIDRIFSGVGRIRCASGTTDARILRGINGMLDLLYARGQYGPMEAIRDRKIKAVHAYGMYRDGALKNLPDAKGLELLQPTWKAWVALTPGKETRLARTYAWKRLSRTLPDNAAPLHLPDALRSLREKMLAQPAAFNRTRAAVLAFVRDKFGKRRPIYEQVVDIPSLTERKHKRSAPTVAVAIQVRDGLPAAASAMWWAMYTTGMGPKEYDGAWEVGVDRVAIHGTKRDSRDRIVPRVGNPTRRSMGWDQYGDALAAFGLQPYDARRGFSHLMEEAGITRIRRKMYMDHALGDVTGGYEKAELSAFRVSDSALMAAKITEAEERQRQERKSGMKSA